MSLVDHPPVREAGLPSTVSQPTKTYSHDQPRRLSHAVSDDSLYEDILYDMDDQEVPSAAPAAKTQTHMAEPSVDAPALPERSALRRSRLFDGLGLLKIASAMDTKELEAASTPHDVYLSSEEEVSSSPDDFSLYDWDSSSDGICSPNLDCHEVTAKAVSFVFVGKPSLVELSPVRRSITPSSTESHSRTSSSSSKLTRSSLERPMSVASSLSSVLHHSPSRKSESLLKRRPPFLNLDPYANGSTYSLDLPHEDADQDVSTPQKPLRTPTQNLIKGVARSFSLVRKRSRPLLSNNNLASPLREEDEPASPAPVPSEVRASKRAMLPLRLASQEQPEQQQQAKADDLDSQAGAPTGKRRLLNLNLASRRKSVRLTGR